MLSSTVPALKTNLPILTYNPINLKGGWHLGWALDYHTVSSQYIAEDEFATVRTEVGEALYQLKYKGDYKQINALAETAAAFIRERGLYCCLDAIIPVPPSNLDRYLQPVYEIAFSIGKSLKLPVLIELIIKTKITSELKDIESKIIRKSELIGAFIVNDKSFCGKNLLLFDDLYRSGDTLNEISKALLNQGEVRKVYVLTLTKTRSKR